MEKTKYENELKEYSDIVLCNIDKVFRNGSKKGKEIEEQFNELKEVMYGAIYYVEGIDRKIIGSHNMCDLDFRVVDYRCKLEYRGGGKYYMVVGSVWSRLSIEGIRGINEFIYALARVLGLYFCLKENLTENNRKIADKRIEKLFEMINR